MSRKLNLSFVSRGLILILIAGFALLAPATAEAQQQLVERTFMILVHVDSAEDVQAFMESLDFLAEDSLMLVTGPPVTPGVHIWMPSWQYVNGEYITGALAVFFDQAPNVIHVTKGRFVELPGLFFWLRDEELPPEIQFPPAGSRCVTGPDGNITFQGWAFMDTFTAGAPEGSTGLMVNGGGDWTNSDYLALFVRGQFTK